MPNGLPDIRKRPEWSHPVRAEHADLVAALLTATFIGNATKTEQRYFDEEEVRAHFRDMREHLKTTPES